MAKIAWPAPAAEGGHSAAASDSAAAVAAPADDGPRPTERDGAEHDAVPAQLGRRVAEGELNALGELGERIFLDRYAHKDMDKAHLSVGDTVVVCVDTATGQREIGVVTAVGGGHATVALDVIGDLVIAQLRLLDDVAYVRFASVYRRFTDLDGLVDEIERLRDQKQRDEEDKRQMRLIEV